MEKGPSNCNVNPPSCRGDFPTCCMLISNCLLFKRRFFNFKFCTGNLGSDYFVYAGWIWIFSRCVDGFSRRESWELQHWVEISISKRHYVSWRLMTNSWGYKIRKKLEHDLYIYFNVIIPFLSPVIKIFNLKFVEVSPKHVINFYANGKRISRNKLSFWATGI